MKAKISFAFTLLLFLTSICHSITVLVDTTVDSSAIAFQACTAAANDCSLRGALLLTNGTPGADTIRIPSGVYSLTIIGGDDASQVLR